MAEVARHYTDHKSSAGDRIMDTHESSHHIVPLSVYWKVIGLLMVLLVITLVAAMFDFSHMGLPWLNIVIAVTIAVVKAVLIILYFMHVRYSSKLIWVFSGAAFYWVLILFAFLLVDYFSRPESLVHQLPH